MNALINKEALNKVFESFPDLSEKQILDIVTLSSQGKLGVRRIGRKLELSKDRVFRVLKRYRMECAKLQLGQSRLEQEVNRLSRETKKLRSTAELEAVKANLEKQKLRYCLKTQGNRFVKNFIERKMKNDSFYCIPDRLYSWTWDHGMYMCHVSAFQLDDSFDLWYKPGKVIYPPTGRLASGEECLAMEIDKRIRIRKANIDRCTNFTNDLPAYKKHWRGLGFSEQTVEDSINRKYKEFKEIEKRCWQQVGGL